MRTQTAGGHRPLPHLELVQQGTSHLDPDLWTARIDREIVRLLCLRSAVHAYASRSARHSSLACLQPERVMTHALRAAKVVGADETLVRRAFRAILDERGERG